MKQEIIQGNCLEILPTLSQDAILISDPPYNQGYHYNEYKDSLETDEYRDLLYQTFSGRKSVIIHYPEETIKILATLDLGNLEEVVSWVYPSNTGKQHRLITFWNVKPDFSKIKQPYKNQDDKRIKDRIFSGSLGADIYDWWEINQVKNVGAEKTEHPCQIPLEIMKRIILTATNDSDIIIDPFMGSGTTLVAAKQLKRNAIGVEISPEYCEIARQRLSQDILL